MSYAVVTLKKGEGRTLKAGGAWIFDNEEDILEELCSLAKKDALIGISEICGRMKMSRREVLACLKQLTA